MIHLMGKNYIIQFFNLNNKTFKITYSQFYDFTFMAFLNFYHN